MFDNLRQIRARYEESLADYQAGQSNVLNTLTIASFFGGLGLVLLVAMLGLMRIVSGTHLWIPAVGATTCCLIIGAILMDPNRLATGQDTAVAFSSYHVPAASAEEVPHRQPSAAEKSPGRIAPPDAAETPFWHPLMIVGPNGKASLGFPPAQIRGYVPRDDRRCMGMAGWAMIERKSSFTMPHDTVR